MESELITWIGGGCLLIINIVLLLRILKKANQPQVAPQIEIPAVNVDTKPITNEVYRLREATASDSKLLREEVVSLQQTAEERLLKRTDDLGRSIENRVGTLTESNKQRLDKLEETVNAQLNQWKHVRIRANSIIKDTAC
jgi:hypothetical protein